MGRSVETPSNARVVCYRDVSDLNNDMFEWDDLEGWVIETVCELWPSMAETYETWLSKETKVLAHNDFANVTISEYCGMCCIALVPAEHDEYYGDEISKQNLAQHWRDQIADKFYETFKQLERLGVMSNGEAVYRKV